MLFAAGIFANKLLLYTLSPGMLVGIRMFVSGVILLILNHRTFRERGSQVLNHWKTFVVIALFTHFIPALCKAYAIKNMSTAKAGLLASIDPFVTALYVYILFSEHLTWKKWVGILFGFSGALMLTTLSSPVEATLRTFAVFSLPELSALASVLVSRFGWIMIQKNVRTNIFSPTEINGVSMTLGGIFSFLSIPLWQAMGSNESFNILSKIDLRVGLLLLCTIVVGNLGAYNMLTYLLKRNSSTLMSIAGFMVPINLAILGYVVLGEPISATLLKAGGLMLVGISIFYYDDLMKTSVVANKS